MTKFSVERARCEGHGICEGAAPDLLHLDETGEVVIDKPDIGPGDLDAATDAVRVCPVGALRLE